MVAILIGLFLASLSSDFHSTTAESSAFYSKDKDEEKEKDKKNNRDDHDEDHILNGQVLAVDTRKDPPELIVGSVDGPTVVRVLKTDEIAMNGVGVGDYVELNGEKINEQLFEATQISVSERFAGEHAENDNQP
jgi:hypothetical protein